MGDSQPIWMPYVNVGMVATKAVNICFLELLSFFRRSMAEYIPGAVSDITKKKTKSLVGYFLDTITKNRCMTEFDVLLSLFVFRGSRFH